MRILNFGSLNIDHVYQVPHFVRPGETLGSMSYQRHIGGKGLNQSIALVRAGLKPFHGGAIGYDGGFLLDKLNGEGVDTGLVRRLTDTPSGHAIIQVDRTGQNCILLHGGANHSITPEQIEETLSGFGHGDWLLMQNELNDVERIWEAAAKKGMRVVWNPSPIVEKPAFLTELPLHMLILNEVEAEVLCGEREPERQILALTELLPKTEIVLTLGENGSVIREPGKEALRQPAVPASPVDTTAAGDTFLGYYVAMRFYDCSAARAARIASVAAAKAVEAPGAAESIPVLDWRSME